MFAIRSELTSRRGSRRVAVGALDSPAIVSPRSALERARNPGDATTRRGSISRSLRILLGSFVIVTAFGFGQVRASSPAAPAAVAPKTCKQIDACRRAVAWHRHKLVKVERALAWNRKIRLRLERAARVLAVPVEHVAQWTCIHGLEGAWNANTGNGYHGGLQMDASFMRTYGSDMIAKYGGYAELWTPRDQMIVAERAYDAGRGFHPWPNTARACGYI